MADAASSTKDDKERTALLKKVSKEGLQNLALDELERLQELIERKDYTHDKKAQKSKLRLLSQIYSKINEIKESEDS